MLIDQIDIFHDVPFLLLFANKKKNVSTALSSQTSNENETILCLKRKSLNALKSELFH
jgi:hypothetical protein